jgi:hypothetical protein
VFAFGKGKAFPEFPDFPLKDFFLVGGEVDVVVLNDADEALVLDL